MIVRNSFNMQLRINTLLFEKANESINLLQIALKTVRQQQ